MIIIKKKNSADDNECRRYCGICDKLCIDRYYNNHLNQELKLIIFI